MELIEVEMLVDLYSNDEEESEEEKEAVLLKEDQVIRKLTILEGLFPQEMFNKEGEPYLDRVSVYDDTLKETYVIKESYESIKAKLMTKANKIGFMKR